MKQRITIDDLIELNKKQSKKLIDWWKPSEGDWMMFGRDIVLLDEVDNFKDFYKQKMFPLLTIGQMIEYLNDNASIKKIEHINQWNEKGEWVVWNMDDTFLDGKDLRSVLWKAVKEVL